MPANPKDQNDPWSVYPVPAAGATDGLNVPSAIEIATPSAGCAAGVALPEVRPSVPAAFCDCPANQLDPAGSAVSTSPHSTTSRPTKIPPDDVAVTVGEPLATFAFANTAIRWSFATSSKYEPICVYEPFVPSATVNVCVSPLTVTNARTVLPAVNAPFGVSDGFPAPASSAALNCRTEATILQRVDHEDPVIRAGPVVAGRGEALRAQRIR